MKTTRQNAIGRILIIGLMLGLWLGTAAFAASPQLHQRLHPDSKSPTHECPVTLLTKSQLLSGSLGSVLPAPAIVLFGGPIPAEFSRPSFAEHRLAPSRAPPTSAA